MPRTPLVFTRAPIDSSRPSIERLVVDRPSPSPAPSRGRRHVPPARRPTSSLPTTAGLKWSLRPIRGAQPQRPSRRRLHRGRHLSRGCAPAPPVRRRGHPCTPWRRAPRPAAPHASAPWHRHGSERCHRGEGLARLVVRRVDRCPNGSANSTEIDMDLLANWERLGNPRGGLAQGQPLLAVTSNCRSVISADGELCAQSTPSRERR
jgi:hypothetical protein